MRAFEADFALAQERHRALQTRLLQLEAALKTLDRDGREKELALLDQEKDLARLGEELERIAQRGRPARGRAGRSWRTALGRPGPRGGGAPAGRRHRRGQGRAAPRSGPARRWSGSTGCVARADLASVRAAQPQGQGGRRRRAARVDWLGAAPHRRRPAARWRSGAPGSSPASPSRTPGPPSCAAGSTAPASTSTGWPPTWRGWPARRWRDGPRRPRGAPGGRPGPRRRAARAARPRRGAAAPTSRPPP